jgi:hypothetical protein
MSYFSKITVFVLAAISLFSCACKKEMAANTSENIDYIYFQKWIGGNALSGSGTNLYLKFEKPLVKDTYLQKAFFQNQEADFDKIDETNYVAHFYGKSTEDLILDGDTDKEYGNEPPEDKREMPDFPYDLKPTEAVLEFHINNKATHVKITNIKEKELIAYPSMDRPKN